MDVHLIGLNGFGQKTGEVFAFWWDGRALKDVLGNRLQPTDPWPTWMATLPSDELKSFAEQHPNVWQAKRAEFNAEMASLLESSVSVQIRIMES